MYESPRDIYDLRNIVSGLLLTRIAGAMYLLSFVLPVAVPFLSWARYGTPTQEVALNYPFSPASLLFPIEGTMLGPLDTAMSEGGAEGLALGLIDLLFFPLLIIGLPVASLVVGILPLLLGVLLLTGYDKHLLAISLTYIGVYSVYAIMLGMKSITLIYGTGVALCLLATLIVFGVSMDRLHNLDLFYHPNYESK